jgi:hypothetical protein
MHFTGYGDPQNPMGGLIMRNEKIKQIIYWVLFVGIICGLGLLTLCFRESILGQRSFVAHAVRWLHGEWGGKQIVVDLATDLSHTSFVNRLQQWSIAVMQRYDKGQVQTYPYEAAWGPVVALRSNEVPDFIAQKWREQPDYEVCLLNRHPESILIDWYSHGIVIGDTNFDIKASRWDGHYYRTLQPGVFVVWYDPK